MLKLEKPWKGFSFISSFIANFLIFGTLTWLIANSLNVSLLNTLLIALAVSFPMALISRAISRQEAAKNNWVSVEEFPEESDSDPIEMTGTRYFFLFIFEGIVFSFFIGCFANLFSYWGRPPHTQETPPVPLLPQFTISLIDTVFFFIWRLRVRRTKKADKEAAWAARSAEGQRKSREDKEEQARRDEKFERDRVAAHEAYLRNSEKESIATQKLRKSRADEVAELEEELARLKLIPSEAEADEQEP